MREKKSECERESIMEVKREKNSKYEKQKASYVFDRMMGGAILRVCPSSSNV